MQNIQRRGALTLAAAALLAPRAQAQTVTRNARMLVGFAAGGPTDLVARLYADRLRPGYAPGAIVENRPGATGRLALEAVRTAEPDGTTMLMSPASVMTLQPHIFPREARHDAVTDFAPVCTLCEFAFGLAVPASHPARSFADLIAWLGAQRGRDVAFGSPGAGSGGHFLGDMVGRALGVTMNHVPYRGAAPAVQDAIAGNIPIAITVLSDIVPHHNQGLRVLVISSPARLPRLPDVPTFAESAYPQLTLTEWMGLFLPARTPAPIVQALYRNVLASSETPEVRQALDRLEFLPVINGPEEFAQRLQRERENWGRIVRESGFRPET
jgi:tripartite-type tricarboxylate transporter receptor subunit TctC